MTRLEEEEVKNTAEYLYDASYAYEVLSGTDSLVGPRDTAYLVIYVACKRPTFLCLVAGFRRLFTASKTRVYVLLPVETLLIQNKKEEKKKKNNALLLEVTTT